MSKTTRLCLLALVALLVICAMPILTRWSFGPGRTVDRPPLSSASPALATAASTRFPALAQARNDTEQSKHERLLLERRKLKQANATLEDARQKAEADKRRAEKNTQAMAMLTGKLLDGGLKVPQNAAEAGKLVGQSLADAARFRQKWGDSIPAAGTAEADEYAREQEALVSESAAYLKFMADEKNAALLTQPDGIAQFQTASLAGALDLRADQVQGISTTLNGYYQQYFALGLNSAARPLTGIEGWQQQRGTLSQQSWAAVSAFLTPEQAATFQRLYPPAGGWLMMMSTPEVPGLDETH